MKLIERTWIVGIFWWNMQNTKPMFIIYDTTIIELNGITNTIEVVSPRYFHVWQGFGEHCLRPHSKIWSFNTEEKNASIEKKKIWLNSQEFKTPSKIFAQQPVANLNCNVRYVCPRLGQTSLYITIPSLKRGAVQKFLTDALSRWVNHSIFLVKN